MKYIRTKDGRILDLNRIKLYAESYSFNDESETHLSVEWDIIREEIDIIAKADTIEELCDEFVYETNENNHYIKDKHNAIQLFFDNEKPVAYYGAIWTDKGLIYVAKMNDKGELELI